MALADRADEIVRGLPRGWERARLELTVEEPEEADRASLLPASATPGRQGGSFTLYVHGESSGLSPTAGPVASDWVEQRQAIASPSPRNCLIANS